MKQLLLKAFSILLLSSAIVSADTGYEYANFHEIHKKNFYRSAQLAPIDLDQFIRTYGIKTVINLRGAEPEEEWYQTERRVTEILKVNLIDIPMSAGSIPHKQNLLTLLEAYKNAPRPLLVHCKAGVDRTGEASALYQMLYMGKSKNEALKMLSIKYGHIEQFKPAKTYFIKTVWQGLDWAYNAYDPCQGQYRYYDTNNSYCHTGVKKDESTVK